MGVCIPDPEQIIRFMGARTCSQELKDSILQTACSLSHELNELLIPRSRTAMLDAKLLTACLQADSHERMRRAIKAVCFVITCNEALERAEEERFRMGNYLEATVVNALALSSLDNEMSRIKAETTWEAERIGLRTAEILSPGCSQVPISWQRELVSLTRADIIGVTVNQAFFCSPAKTVCGIIPIGHESDGQDTCACCDAFSTCLFRRLT